MTGRPAIINAAGVEGTDITVSTASSTRSGFPRPSGGRTMLNDIRLAELEADACVASCDDCPDVKQAIRELREARAERALLAEDLGRMSRTVQRLQAERDRLATIVERARNGDPQLIDGIEDYMASEAAQAAAKGAES